MRGYYSGRFRDNDYLAAKVECRRSFNRTFGAVPEMKALYETGINESRRSAYTVALTDFLTKPVVKDIDKTVYTGAIGQTIKVRATDDFKVKSVLATILDPTGAVIESGSAVLPETSASYWQYVTAAANATLTGSKIRAVATDYAENSATLEIVL